MPVVSDLVIYSLIGMQIVTLSVVSGFRWVYRQSKLFLTYPASDYPNYYAFSFNIEKILISLRVVLDLCAVALVTSVIIWDYHAPSDLFYVWIMCTSVQLLPSLYSLAVLRLSSKRRARKIKTTKQKVSLIHRSIFDYLSISYIALLLVSVLLTLNIILSNEQLLLSRKASLVAIFIATNLLLIRKIYSALYGKSADKLIANTDRSKKRQLDVQQSFIGIAASVVIFSLLGLSGADSSSNAIWLAIPLSLFIQLSVFVRSRRWQPENMEVYRIETAQSGNEK